jgi:spermidine synthase
LASIEVSEERGVRYLHFGSRWIQGAMRVARPWALELEYTREMMLPLLLREERGWPARILQVGLGSASLTRFIHRHLPQSRMTVVEILPEVVAAARQFFKLPDDPARLRIEIADGHEFMATTRSRYDLILVDGFDDKGRSGMLDTAPFYANCRARLAPHGMLSVNLLTRKRGSSPSIDRLREAFDERVLALPPCNAGNAVAVASEGAVEETFAQLRRGAARLKERAGLDLAPTLARIAAARGAAALQL